MQFRLLFAMFFFLKYARTSLQGKSFLFFFSLFWSSLDTENNSIDAFKMLKLGQNDSVIYCLLSILTSTL